ncbi:hypothetical protein DY000_02039362 [Brassica cretica]|uniref:Uncharacterized protein n=1 Tax=Brassica cretica TaxID=69181 RepID=A0ABQ7B7J3_BRACR|nr:hypothetical protein DY000_02039362 [Brassica cretica]
MFLSASPVRQTGVCHSTFESRRLGLSSQSIASGFLRFWDSLNFKKDREFVGITVLFLDEIFDLSHLFNIIVLIYFLILCWIILFADSVIHEFTPVGRANHYMTSLKADSIVKVDRFELQARLQSGKFKWNDIPTTETASVKDSSLPRIALTMVSGKKKILLLKKDRDNTVNSPFQAEHQMKANFSGSSSTSRQNQKIDVGGRFIKGILQRSETA